MKKITSAVVLGSLIGMSIFGLSGCERGSKVVSENLSKDADEFRIQRRIIAINGITDKYLFEVQGLCSITHDKADNQLEITCKTGSRQYKKHFVGISDNVTYIVQQVDGAYSNPYHNKIIFRPQQILPLMNIEMKTSVGSLGTDTINTAPASKNAVTDTLFSAPTGK